ncbi:hypothetical protein Poli38472_005104 [Pythium oligandrum]|uniref:Uncharacterized protein n=1 Tax=Pythium oligandrum TaxID=41045 RepID=A0A8K1CGQ1_PYTOL|nr:hypothetical protein Poli38472_005104 [Pythium oligandrum]|eukprot:TMW62486.1 hypothetical protein Poli38472_005104 [Pythium oligandrum]
MRLSQVPRTPSASGERDQRKQQLDEWRLKRQEALLQQQQQKTTRPRMASPSVTTSEKQRLLQQRRENMMAPSVKSALGADRQRPSAAPRATVSPQPTTRVPHTSPTTASRTPAKQRIATPTTRAMTRTPASSSSKASSQESTASRSRSPRTPTPPLSSPPSARYQRPLSRSPVRSAPRERRLTQRTPVSRPPPVDIQPPPPPDEPESSEMESFDLHLPLYSDDGRSNASTEDTIHDQLAHGDHGIEEDTLPLHIRDLMETDDDDTKSEEALEEGPDTSEHTEDKQEDEEDELGESPPSPLLPMEPTPDEPPPPEPDHDDSDEVILRLHLKSRDVLTDQSQQFEGENLRSELTEDAFHEGGDSPTEEDSEDKLPLDEPLDELQLEELFAHTAKALGLETGDDVAGATVESEFVDESIEETVHETTDGEPSNEVVEETDTMEEHILLLNKHTRPYSIPVKVNEVGVEPILLLERIETQTKKTVESIRLDEEPKIESERAPLHLAMEEDEKTKEGMSEEHAAAVSEESTVEFGTTPSPSAEEHEDQVGLDSVAETVPFGEETTGESGTLPQAWEDEQTADTSTRPQARSVEDEEQTTESSTDEGFEVSWRLGLFRGVLVSVVCLVVIEILVTGSSIFTAVNTVAHTVWGWIMSVGRSMGMQSLCTGLQSLGSTMGSFFKGTHRTNHEGVIKSDFAESGRSSWLLNVVKGSLMLFKDPIGAAISVFCDMSGLVADIMTSVYFFFAATPPTVDPRIVMNARERLRELEAYQALVQAKLNDLMHTNEAWAVEVIERVKGRRVAQASGTQSIVTETKQIMADAIAETQLSATQQIREYAASLMREYVTGAQSEIREYEQALADEARQELQYQADISRWKLAEAAKVEAEELELARMRVIGKLSEEVSVIEEEIAIAKQEAEADVIADAEQAESQIEEDAQQAIQDLENTVQDHIEDLETVTVESERHVDQIVREQEERLAVAEKHAIDTVVEVIVEEVVNSEKAREAAEAEVETAIEQAKAKLHQRREEAEELVRATLRAEEVLDAKREEVLGELAAEGMDEIKTLNEALMNAVKEVEAIEQASIEALRAGMETAKSQIAAEVVAEAECLLSEAETVASMITEDAEQAEAMLIRAKVAAEGAVEKMAAEEAERLRRDFLKANEDVASVLHDTESKIASIAGLSQDSTPLKELPEPLNYTPVPMLPGIKLYPTDFRNFIAVSAVFASFGALTLYILVTGRHKRATRRRPRRSWLGDSDVPEVVTLLPADGSTEPEPEAIEYSQQDPIDAPSFESEEESTEEEMEEEGSTSSEEAEEEEVEEAPAPRRSLRRRVGHAGW